MSAADGLSGAQSNATPENESEGTSIAATAPGRVRRRATLAAVPGSDPHPGDAPLTPRGADENDSRLREGKPPHWG